MYALLSCSVMSDSLWPHGLWLARLLCPWGFFKQAYWSGLPCLPGDRPNPGIEPRSPALQVDSLPTELPGKPKLRIRSVPFSRSVVSDSLRPLESQQARPPCPSPTPRIHPNPCPSSRWCHPAISSSVVPFSSCSQSLPASESFPMRINLLFVLNFNSDGSVLFSDLAAQPVTSCCPCCQPHSFASPAWPLEASDGFIQFSFHDEASGPKSCRDHLAPKCRVGQRQRQRQSQVSWKSSLLSHLTTSLHFPMHSSCSHYTDNASSHFQILECFQCYVKKWPEVSLPYIYTYLAVLSLYCHVGYFSSCSHWGLLSSWGMQASHCDGFSCCRARALGHAGFSSCSTWAL